MKFFKFRANKILLGSFLLIYLIGYTAAICSPNVDVAYVYKVCPVFNIYTNNFIDDSEAGSNKGIFNIMRPEDRGTIVVEHELIHSKQCYRTFYLGTIFAFLNKSYLAKCEAEAYSIEINSEAQIFTYAKMIQECYSPNIPTKIIEGYIRNYL
jgi:hypothetical protein